MNKELQNIISFCRQAKNLICFGTGDYAEMLCEFLAYNEIIPKMFCVSDGQIIINNTIRGRKVYHVSDLDNSNEYDIIIALSEKWHPDVIKALEKVNCVDALAVTDEIGRILRIWSSICSNTIENTLGEYDENEFERKFQELRVKYHHIEVRRSTGDTIGALILEYIYLSKYKCHKENIFYLYSPSSKEPMRSNTYSYPNRVLYKHFKGLNFSSVHGDSLCFWKYILTKHPDFIEINTNYNYKSNVMEAAIDRMHEHIFTNLGADYFWFDEEEINYAKQQMNNLGIKENFICIYSRDAGYYQATWKNIDEPLRIMDKYRNSSFTNFISAAKYLKNRNVQSVRVGSYPKTNLHETCIIDYAGQAHDDLMDFYLAKKCRFYLGDHSGVILFQALFGTPMAMVNVPNITGYADGTFPFVRERDIIIFHKLWDPQKNRLLNLSEILEIENCYNDDYHYSGNVRIFEKYNELGIVPIENTEDEILALAKEMEAKLNGEDYYTTEDEALQKCYWDILTPHLKKHKRALWYDARVGRDFLRENSWLTC